MKRLLATALLALSGIGCAAPIEYPLRSAPEALVERMGRGDRPILALVLSEGSWRAFAHIGVIRVLEQAGVRPDLVVGVSGGAIVGALYASGADAGELSRIAGIADWSRVTEHALPLLLEDALYRGEGLQSLIDELVDGRTIERLAIPFAAIVTELDTGRLAVFRRGPTGLAVRASGAVPGRYRPVRIGDHQYADGGLVSPLPAMAARLLGAGFVIAVDVGYPPGEAVLDGFMSYVYQAFHVQKHRIRQMEAEAADMVIAPVIPPTSGDYGAADREMLIAAGEHTALRDLPTLLRKLASWRTSTQASTRLQPGVPPADPPTKKENSQ